MNNIIWLLDNGHGDNTSGKRSPEWEDKSQLFEYEFNRDIVLRIAEKLKRNRMEYKILVPEMNDIALKERVRRANEYAINHPDMKPIYVSIHGNAFGLKGANGYEIFTSKGETKSDKIATIFYRNAINLGINMRKDYTDGDPDKEDNFTVLTKTSMPAILTESGFYTNEKECKLMLSDEFRNKIAQVHLDAMIECERNKII